MNAQVAVAKKPEKSQVKNIVELPRGGYLVKTSEGQIQFGAPPETIKDTIVTKESVPQIFVLPRYLFHWQKGINVADMEFPLYFNFFIKKKKTLIIGTEAQCRRMIIALREAVFGPQDLDLNKDASTSAISYVPDIRGELSYFRGKLELTDLFSLKIFRQREVQHGNVTIRINRDRDFEVHDNKKLLTTVPGNTNYSAKIIIGQRLSEPFIPPRFAVTCLGPSHGFDPQDNTSGFIIWLNGNGIMIDPPVNTTEWLVESNVNPKFIDSIILTHCHADHDAGTFQKILEEERITVYTTPTVMSSFLRKYSAFSGESIVFLRSLFTYHPVYMGRPFYLHGGEFDISYSFHSIPTMAFRLRFQDKTFVYSSDHQNDPVVQKELYKKKLITKERYDQLQDFPWDSDVIYHESGIAPLHTPITFLNSLDEEIQKKTVVYHIARKDFPAPAETKLTHATFGIENTLYFKTKGVIYEESSKMLDILKHLEFFRYLPPDRVQELMFIMEQKTVKRGEKIIEKGTKGDYFYIIKYGNARVDVAGLARGKYLGAFEYFGEVALMANTTRTADIIAETDVQLYAIEKQRFLSFIAGSEFEELLQRLIKNRSEDTWNTLVSSPHLNLLTDYQLMWLESVLERVERQGSGIILREGERLPGIYIISSGQVSVSKRGDSIGQLKRGDIIGSAERMQSGDIAEYTFSHTRSVQLFFINSKNLQHFIENNPGSIIRITYSLHSKQ